MLGERKTEYIAKDRDMQIIRNCQKVGNDESKKKTEEVLTDEKWWKGSRNPLQHGGLV